MSRDRRDKGGGDGGGGHERWLLTYADMITLLLALFIVLFAMSSIDAKRFDNLRRSLSQTFQGQVLSEPGAVVDGSSGVLDPTAANQDPDAAISLTPEQATDASTATRESYDREQRQLQEQVEAQGLAEDVEVVQNQRGIVISLAGDSLFESGSAELRDGMKGALDTIARDVRANGRVIEIVGHTDGAPYPASGPYDDNVGLSSARALSVFRYLWKEGRVDPTRMEPSGKGEWDPRVTPSSPTASVAKNRRVEILILAPGANAGLSLDRDGNVDRDVDGAAAGSGPAAGRDGGRPQQPQLGVIPAIGESFAAGGPITANPDDGFIAPIGAASGG